MSPDDDLDMIARVARCAADLYRRVPRQGAGLTAHAEELAHAADLETQALVIDSGADVEVDGGLRTRDVREVMQLLIDARRTPHQLDAASLAVAREHFPEVDANGFAPIEAVLERMMALVRSR